MTDETPDRRAPGQSTADRPQAPQLPQQPPGPAAQQPAQPPQPQSTQPQPQPSERQPPAQRPPESSNGTQGLAHDEKAKIRSATRDLSGRPEAPADVPEPQNGPQEAQTASQAQATTANQDQPTNERQVAERAHAAVAGEAAGREQTDRAAARIEQPGAVPAETAAPSARASDPATEAGTPDAALDAAPEDVTEDEAEDEAEGQTATSSAKATELATEAVDDAALDAVDEDESQASDETEAGEKAARQADGQARPPGDGTNGGGAWAAWRRIREGILPSRGQAIVGVVLGLVAFLAVVQVRQNLAGDGYANARREDLIEILDGLGQSSRRLESEIADLQARKAQLSSGANQAETARSQAEQQIKVLGILAGTLPAQGPGVRITLNDPNAKVESGNLLDAIEELRDAGAEAIQINGRARVVASTDFTDEPPGIRVDGERLQPPYVIEAIGDSHNLSEAARFPGGLVSEVTGPQINGTAEVKEVQTLRITALHTPQQHRYARPAASPTK